MGYYITKDSIKHIPGKANYCYFMGNRYGVPTLTKMTGLSSTTINQRIKQVVAGKRKISDMFNEQQQYVPVSCVVDGKTYTYKDIAKITGLAVSNAIIRVHNFNNGNKSLSTLFRKTRGKNHNKAEARLTKVTEPTKFDIEMAHVDVEGMKARQLARDKEYMAALAMVR